MNQHKDVLYRQKYATYQLNNRTFSTQNTKISARSLAQVTYVFRYVLSKKKEKRREKSHTINYYGKSGDSSTPDPRQGRYTRNNGRNYTFYHSWRPSWRPLFAENSRASGGSAPWAPGRGFALHPRRGPTAGRPGPHPYEARAVRFAHGFFRPPLFCKSWISHCTHPPLLVQVACPQRRRSWGSWGAVAPPPPMKILGGKHIVSPPPPPIISSTWKNDM